MKKKKIIEQLKDMEDQQIIEDSVSPYSAPIVMIPKDKDYRFCVDYLRLNEAMFDEECSRLNIKDLIDLVGDKIFTSLDLKKGYWQVRLSEESKEFTAFTTPNGLRKQFRVVPFGLKTAPGLFMRIFWIS